MNGYNFTERVRKVLAMAREEAVLLRHEYVGTEHILLGIIREGEGVAVAALLNLGADFDDIRSRIAAVVKKGKADQRTNLELPYTSRAKKTLELAMHEARELNHSYVGTEHLLLGLLAEERGVAAQVLGDAGIGLEQAREETLLLLRGEVRKLREPTEPMKTREGVRPVTLTVQVDWEDGRRFKQRFRTAAEAIEFLRSLEGEPPRPDQA